MSRFLVVAVFLLHSSILFAQGQIDSVHKALIRHENTVGGMLYTNGWGVGYSYGKMEKAKLKTLFSADFQIVHDPKEFKTTNPSSSENNRFVYGKTHFLMNVHFTYGKIYRLFDKKDIGGIEIRHYFNFGPVFGLQKPIYYIFKDNNVETIGKFISTTHRKIGDIEGKASFFKGFDEINVIPGLHVKTGFSFEFGRQDLIINALEGGVSVDLFPKKVEIMANDDQQFIFPALYLSLRFGKINNPRLKKNKTKQQEN